MKKVIAALCFLGLFLSVNAPGFAYEGWRGGYGGYNGGYGHHNGYYEGRGNNRNYISFNASFGVPVTPVYTVHYELDPYIHGCTSYSCPYYPPPPPPQSYTVVRYNY